MRGKIIQALIILSILLLLGCQAPVAPEEEPAVSVEAPTEEAAPEPAAEAEPEPEPVAAPVSAGPVDIDKICETLLTEEEWTNICGINAQLTKQETTGGCWINAKDKTSPRLTGGFTVTDWHKADEATEEFERGVSMRATQGAVESQAVSERSYEYDELNRHNVVWLRGTFVTRLGAMNELCPADKLVEIAKIIDSRMR